VWRELDHPVEIASVLRHLGQVAARLNDGRPGEASQYFKEALQLALEHRLAPIALDVLVGLARFQQQPEQAEGAVELAALAEHHPASTHQTRQLARQQLATLAKLLPAETFAAAQSRGQALDWQTSAAKVVAAIAPISPRSQPRKSPPPVAQPGPPADWQLRFKQQTLIASGGIGEVYRGQDLETGQLVAIKRVKPNQLFDNSAAVQRLIHEGELLRQLNHPNIVKVLATIETGEEAIIVMEYVPGGSLRELLNEEPQLPLARAVNIGLELADALASLADVRQGLAHRELMQAQLALEEVDNL
jgi:hypothetical protein